MKKPYTTPVLAAGNTNGHSIAPLALAPLAMMSTYSVAAAAVGLAAGVAAGAAAVTSLVKAMPFDGKYPSMEPIS